MSALPQAVLDWLALQPAHMVQSFMLDLASRREGDSTTGSVNSLQEVEEPSAGEPKPMPAREPWEPPSEEEQDRFFKKKPHQPPAEDTELQPAQPEQPKPPQPSPLDDTELIQALESFDLIDLETPAGTNTDPSPIEVPKAEDVPEANVAVKAMPKPSNKITEGTQPTRFTKQQHAPPTATALPTTEPTVPPPGEDIWWTSRPITDINSTEPNQF